MKAKHPQNSAHAKVEAIPSGELDRLVKERTADLEHFVLCAAHDLRAPLWVIIEFATTLRERYSNGLDSEGKRILEILSGQAENMSKSLQDLLDLSGVSARFIARSKVDMTRLARSVYEALARSAVGRRVELRLGELPLVRGDELLLRQVLVNLLSNAFKFTEERDSAVIEITGLQREDVCEYCVRDNGIGFGTENISKLFRPFERLSRAKRYAGSGLGLFIAQRAVHRHGGCIWAEGSRDQGAAFHFTIPSANEPLHFSPGN